MGAATLAVSPWMMLPFGVLLGLIALMPLVAGPWWNRHYPKVALGLAALVVAWYAWTFQGTGFPSLWAVVAEYISFIALTGSLFIVAGGIHIQVKGGSTPLRNILFLGTGVLLANVFGTTGASMLLIRPWLRMNSRRVAPYHVVFFIFIVSNVGGCLTPVGDPPLYLGYLAGVPFWWILPHCVAAWAVGVGILLAIFFIMDWRNFAQAQRSNLPAVETDSHQWRFDGRRNLFFLAIILAAVFVDRPMFLRELLFAGAAAASWYTTPKTAHAANHFDFHPLREVAVLFAGIFVTMAPVLDWLQGNAGRFNAGNPTLLFWGAGSLSSVLDSAPTYVCFLKAISARFTDPDVVAHVRQLVATHGADLAGVTDTHASAITQTWMAVQRYFPTELAAGTIDAAKIQVATLLADPALSHYIVAISVGAVLFGANTYLGNGPNLMVKAIADRRKIPCPGFLGFILRYTLPVMLPMLLIVWWLFFRR